MRLLALACVLLACVSPALAQADKKRQKALEKLSQKLGVPQEALDEAKAERLLGDAAARRALLSELGARPRGALFPIVVEMALHEKEFELRQAAIKSLSVVGLEADRAVYLEKFLPALPRLVGDELDKVRLGAMDEATRLARWFQCDPEVAPLLERTFRSEDFRCAQKAFYGLVELEHPDLRQKLVAKVLREVLDPKTKFGLYERKRAVTESGKRRGPATAAEMAEWLLKDGPIAIECANALGELGDQSVLPRLRKVDRTASHALRIPAYMARAKLADPQLLQELDGVFADDHEAIQRAVLRALAEHPAPDAATALVKLIPRATDPDVRTEIALARLRRGDPGDIPHLRKGLEAAAPDEALAGKVLAIDHPAGKELVLYLLQRADQAEGTRARAADRAGTFGLQDAVPALRKAQEGGPSAFKLRAAASLLQLGEPDGVAAVSSALIDLEVVSREDVSTGVGTARRWTGSPLVDVCRRLAQDGAVAALPLIAGWLDPPGRAAAPPKPDPGAKDPSKERKDEPAAAPPPPKWPKHLEHPNVRRGVVRALGELIGKAQALPEGEAATAAKPGIVRGIAALRRALDDPAALVRTAALGALAKLSRKAELPPGSSPAVEPELKKAIEPWLKEQG